MVAAPLCHGMQVMQIKRLCRKAAVEKVDAGPKGIVMTMRHQDVKDPSIIMNAITTNSGWRLRPDQTILVMGNYQDPQPRIKGTVKALKALID